MDGWVLGKKAVWNGCFGKVTEVLRVFEAVGMGRLRVDGVIGMRGDIGKDILKQIMDEDRKEVNGFGVYYGKGEMRVVGKQLSG